MTSHFRRVHATSPCLSTAIGNRHLPRDEGLDHQIFGFLFRIVANAARSGSRAVHVLYQTVANADKRAAGNGSQARENRSDNFFTFVTEEMHETNPRIAFRA